MRLEDFVRRQRSILFVASGPSKVLTPTWRPHFGAIAVHAQTLLDVEGSVDYATFVDWNVALTCQSQFHRVKKFFVPDQMLHTEDINNNRTPQSIGIPASRSITFPKEIQRGNRDDADRYIIDENKLYFVCGTPLTIHILAMLGYKEIFCLGHNDLEGKVEGYYPLPRKAVEFAADAVAIRYGCRVTFWMPGMEPENWRMVERRGFLFGR
jgi:hypothetical protein